MEKTYIIIGTSAAGLGAAYALARADDAATILCISNEQEQPYNKCFLVDYLSGHREYEQLFTLREELRKNPRFKLLLGKKVVAVDTKNMSIRLSDDQIFSYHKLFMAMGASPYKLNVPGIDAYEGIFTFYTLRDMNDVVAYCGRYQVKSAVVIGAGFSGLECAHALALRGYKVTLIERSDRLLPHYTDALGSSCLQQAAKNMGIQIKTGCMVTSIEGKSGCITGIVLDDGTLVGADLLISAVGMRSNSQLAKQAGIELHGQHVKVTNRLQTSNEHIFAAGDLVVAPSLITGELVANTTWADALLQGTVAGYNMAGVVRLYQGIIGYTVSQFFGFDIAACGVFGTSDTRQRIVVNRPGAYRIFELESGFLKAFLLIGSTEHAASVCRRALLTGQSIPLQELESLL